MNIARIAILLTFSWIVGCTTRAPQWTATPVRKKDSPWDRVIAHIELSESSLSNAVALIQRLANEAGAPEISLHIAEAPNPLRFFTTLSELDETLKDLDAPRPISTELQRATIRDVLTYVADLANYRVFYKGNEAVLAPLVRSYDFVPVRLDGYCRARNTATGVGKFTLVCTWRPLTCCDDESVTTTHEVVTRRDGAFSLTIEVPGYAKVAGANYIVSLHPKVQQASFIAVADDYHPKRFAVALVESNLLYHVDIELER